MDGFAARKRPNATLGGYQSWRDILFVSWEVPKVLLHAILHPGLSLDTFDGRSYITATLFRLRDVRPRTLPSVPVISSYFEVNLRTYVRKNGLSGIWYFTIETTSVVCLTLGRLFWHLPYHRARIRHKDQGRHKEYVCRRACPPFASPRMHVTYRVGERIGRVADRTLECFLSERHVLFARKPLGLEYSQVHHEPHDLYRVDVLEFSETLSRVTGIPGPTTDLLALYSPGVDVEVYEPITL